MASSDGKKYNTDCANTEGIFRIIQSIPSPKAEPFKQWLAKVGYERVQEIENPELAAERARKYYKELGYSDDWIEKRIQILQSPPKQQKHRRFFMQIRQLCLLPIGYRHGYYFFTW